MEALGSSTPSKSTVSTVAFNLAREEVIYLEPEIKDSVSGCQPGSNII